MNTRGNTKIQFPIVDEINMRPANPRFSRAFTDMSNLVPQHPSHGEGDYNMSVYLTDNPIVRNPPSTADDTTFDFAAEYDRSKANRREKLQRDRDRRRNRFDD